MAVVAPEAPSPERGQGPRGAHRGRGRARRRAPRSTCSIRATRSSRRRTSSPTPTSRPTRCDPGPIGRHGDTGAHRRRRAPTRPERRRRQRTTPAPTVVETKTVVYRYVIDVTFIDERREAQDQGHGAPRASCRARQPAARLPRREQERRRTRFPRGLHAHRRRRGQVQAEQDRTARFLYLGAGSEHELTNDEGDSYTLRVDQIRKVKVGRRRVPREAGSRRRPTTPPRRTRQSGSEPAARRFVPPFLTDLVSVTGGSEELSDDGQTGR